jgi:hypothetical protein
VRIPPWIPACAGMTGLDDVGRPHTLIYVAISPTACASITLATLAQIVPRRSRSTFPPRRAWRTASRNEDKGYVAAMGTWIALEATSGTVSRNAA